ncbi:MULTISPECIES: hypothetical protein [Paenibacillus]|uniref:hypothetical protein n=1 Tax=Paenibacillus TaxID=44249 RepID=UPI0025A2FD11|nr:hypothetical protein [Paenibacillus sp. PK1-4R]WJM10688.1 hypothetical protein QNO02_12440 [Paenibacillus sp. PK1-4R]
MSPLTNCYKVKLITRSDDEDYIKALKIYEDQTPVEIQTATNEISYWIEKSKDSVDFTFMVFAVYLDNTVIGYSQTSYFSQNRFVLFDYITFSKDFRVNAVFFPVFSLIKSYFKDRMNLPVDYWITEISDRDNGKQIDKESAFLKKLLYMENFCSIDIDYVQPQLGGTNYESSFPCKLYLQTNSEIFQLSKETVNSIVKSIYYAYYFNWYVPFLKDSELKIYKSNLDKHYDYFKKSIYDKESISVKYNKNLLDDAHSQITSGSVPASKKKSKTLKYSFFVSCVIVIPILVVVLSNLLFKIFGFELDITSSFSGIMPAVLSAIVVWLTSRKGEKF